MGRSSYLSKPAMPGKSSDVIRTIHRERIGRCSSTRSSTTSFRTFRSSISLSNCCSWTRSIAHVENVTSVHRAGIATELPPSADEALRIAAAFCRSAFWQCWAAHCAFVLLTRVPVTAASSRSMRSAIPSTTSKVLASASSPVRGTRTLCWSPGLSPGTWKSRCDGLTRQRRIRNWLSRSATVAAPEEFSARATRAVVAYRMSSRWT